MYGGYGAGLVCASYFTDGFRKAQVTQVAACNEQYPGQRVLSAQYAVFRFPIAVRHADVRRAGDIAVPLHGTTGPRHWTITEQATQSQTRWRVTCVQPALPTARFPRSCDVGLKQLLMLVRRWRTDCKRLGRFAVHAGNLDCSPC